MVLIWLLFSTVTIAVLIYYLFLAPILDNLLHAVPNEPPVARYYILLFGYILNSIKTPYEFFHWLHQKYGDRCIISFASSRYIFLNDQATFMNCIVKDPAFTLNPLDKLTCRIGGVRWECIRNKEAQSALLQEHQELLSGQELLVLNHKTCDYLIKRLTEDQLSSSSFKIVNLFDNFDEIIFNTTITVLYGETFAQSQPDLHSSFRIFNSVAGTLMFNVPFKSFFLRSAIRKRDQFVQRFIDLKPNDDMSKRVSALIELMESLNHGTIFNERDRAGCHAMLIWGAMVNTVPIVCWSLVDLLIRPDALKAVKDELTAKVTSIASLDEKETLDELHILDSCIQETMRRILPSITHREASENVTVTCSDGTQMGVRKSDIVAYPACIKYFDSKIYDHPDEYHCDRFIKQQQSKVRPLLLFGTGSRMCPGRYWAIHEIKLLLALILIKFDIELMMDDDYKQKMCTRLDFQLSTILMNLGPHEKDKHQYRVRYSMKK